MNKDQIAALRKQLVNQLQGSEAHSDLAQGLKDLPADVRGKRPRGAPHSPWEVLEHMRIAQWDILEFSRDSDHVSPKWPDGYWPPKPEPPNDKAWDRSVHQFCQDNDALCKLIADESIDVFARIPHGKGQTVLREALLAADHNAYHLGQLVLLRRMLGAWNAG
ncbi:MAG TPA: DinB family protein [Terracidiphilus sp.]|jgi:hypothetical protein|nr:DinB family protein [Terracidiphilus sp.]